MTRQDHLLTIIAEECVETAQRATKALRFGLDEVQPGQDMSNAKRMMQEYIDLSTAMKMLADQNPEFNAVWVDHGQIAEWSIAKEAKVNHFLEYSARQGRLDG